MWLRYFWNAGAGCVWRKDAHEQDRLESEEHGPEYVEYVAHEILAEAAIPVVEHLRPREPLGTLGIVVRVVGDVLGGPAALGLVEPEGVDAYAVLDVRDPVGADVDNGGGEARRQAHEEHTNPARPRVV